MSPVGQSVRFKVVIFFGVLLVLVFIAVIALLLSNRPTVATTKTVVVEKEAAVKMMDVLVPVSDVPMGAPLEPSMFRKESRPQVGVDPRSVRDFEELKGHYARSLLVSGQPLHRDFITSVRPANALTANIPDGFRAVTIRVDARTSVEGFTQPGATVDVHWSSTLKGQPAVKVIVQNAKVLSAERQTDASAKPGAAVPSTVTLLVSARDAAKIQLASTTGSLSLSLRGDTDTGKGIPEDQVTINDLLGAGDAPGAERKEGRIRIGEVWFDVLPSGKMVPADK